MKNSQVKTKVAAGLIALSMMGGMAVTATSALAKDSLNDDVNIIVASSDNYGERDEYSKDSSREKEERSRKDSRHERNERRDRNSDDDSRNYDDSKTTEVTLEDAVKIATTDTPGRVIEVEFERGRYEVKIRTKDGYKKEIYVSAKSGKIVKRK